MRWIVAATFSALVACQQTGPSSAPSPTSTPTTTPSFTIGSPSPSPDETPESEPLPVSQFANGCVKENKRLSTQFTDLLEGGFSFTQEDADRLFSEVQEIAYVLALNGGAMEIELEEEGPVRNGDDCLFGAALNLKIIAGIFPSPIDQRRTEREALGLFQSIVKYYPDSELAEDVQGDIADLT